MSDTGIRPVARGLRVVWENVRLATRAILGNRLRSFLTLLGIVIGVVVVIVMVGIIEGFKGGITASMTSFGATLVQFQKYEPRFGAVTPAVIIKKSLLPEPCSPPIAQKSPAFTVQFTFAVTIAAEFFTAGPPVLQTLSRAPVTSPGVVVIGVGLTQTTTPRSA